MARMSNRDLSLWLDDFMDTVGYSRADLKQRIFYMNRCSFAKNMSNKILINKHYIDKIAVGSQREGVSLRYMSDLDTMQINNGVSCLSDVTADVVRDAGKTIFQVVREGQPHGYCKLKLYSVGDEERFKDISYAVQEHRNEMYLSSETYVERNEDFFFNSQASIAKDMVYLQRHGPALQKFVAFSTFQKNVLAVLGIHICPERMDLVKALPCQCPDILQRWCSRQRRFDWPSHDTIHHVASLPSHVVPVGHSAYSDLQWRICYTLAEVHLVQSFNNTQTKVYVFLKFIAKQLLPQNGLVTSYVIKNIMFWLCEKTPMCSFKPSNIIKLVARALKRLRRSLRKRRLPNYMIPERNLYQDNIESEEATIVVYAISDLLTSGRGLLQSQIYLLEENDVPESKSVWLDDLNLLYISDVYAKLKVQTLDDLELVHYLKNVSTSTDRLTLVLIAIDDVIRVLAAYGLQAVRDPCGIFIEPPDLRTETIDVSEDLSMMDRFEKKFCFCRTCCCKLAGSILKKLFYFFKVTLLLYTILLFIEFVCIKLL